MKKIISRKEGKPRTFDAGEKKIKSKKKSKRKKRKRGKSYFCWDCTGSRAQFLHVSERLNTVFPNKD